MSLAIRERLTKVMGIAHFELALRNGTKHQCHSSRRIGTRQRPSSLRRSRLKRNGRTNVFRSLLLRLVQLWEHIYLVQRAHQPICTTLICAVTLKLLTKQHISMWIKIRGVGGLPVGGSGKVLVMLSGGIDSPVAAWRMIKRGVKALFVHFYSYPYTDKASLEKVEELAGILATWNYRTQIYFVPFADVQREIVTQTPAPFRVILYRRMMVRIAQQIAAAAKAECLVTGESLGQVASQTLGNLRVIEEIAEIPILRPLIGDDKAEIMELAERIGTFETSILPHDDCCSLFVPDHPATHASLEAVQNAEAALDIKALVKRAVESVEKKIIDNHQS